MAAQRPTEAERMAKARQEFAEAMARGCTIPQLREAKARERSAAAWTRLRTRMDDRPPVALPAHQTDAGQRQGYWWERD